MQYTDQSARTGSKQLALVLDGLPLRGGSPSAYAVQAVLECLTTEESRQLARLRQELGPEVGIIDSHFDDVPLLLTQMGFAPRKIAGEDLDASRIRFAAIGCPHRHTRLDLADVRRFMDQGGVLLSSDRAIRLPGIGSFVGHLPGRARTRARLAAGISDGLPAQSPVWLEPGHIPLDPSSTGNEDSAVMAWNSLTGEPIVVRVRSGIGGIVHSVAHWVQVPDALTSVEARPLRRVPRYRAIGNSYPYLTFGLFMAQRSMTGILIRGLSAVLGSGGAALRPSVHRRK